MLMSRDLTAAQASAGGYLVETSNQGFVELLRNASVCFSMGATRLNGLQGNVTIPKRTGGATGYWLGTEATQVTESGQTFGQISMTPKTVGAYNELSRQLLIQSSPSAEQLVMSGLALDVGTAVDLAGLNGSGNAGQPLGVIGTSGIGGVTGASFDYADIVEFQTDVAAANALAGSLGYVTTPAIAGLCKARVKFSSTASPLWEGRLERGSMDGYPAMSSSQMPSGDMLFGDWSQMVIGEWGVLEIAVNQQANFQAAIIGVRALYSVDIAIRIPAAFSLMTSAT
jgi:HK97 family phage major capsid protein